MLDTEAVCDPGVLAPTLERLCAAPCGSDAALCERLESGASFRELAAAAARRPRMRLALTARHLASGRPLEEGDLHRVVMASFDVDPEGPCAASARAELERLHEARCGAGPGVLRRPERGRWCAAVQQASCALAAREAASVRRHDLGRAGELFRDLSQDRGCAPRAEQAWEYGAQARRAFDAARRFQDAQRVDEALAERPRPIREVPHAPPWRRGRAAWR